MPFRTTRTLVPEAKELPASAKKIYLAKFRASLKEKPEDLAHSLAMSAVKKEFTKLEGEGGEDEWVKRGEAEKRTEKEMAEAIEAIEGEEALRSGKVDPETGEPIEGEGDEDDLEGGEDTPIEEGEEDDEDDEPAYTKTTKTRETTETRGRLRRKLAAAIEGGATDSVEMTELLTFDAMGFRLTEDGYLVTEPRVARTGIQIYKGWEVGRPDMDEVRVYRPEAEVFDKKAMASLAHRTITLEHPQTRVDASNWKELAVGHSSEPVARDGDFIRVPLVLMDAHAIGAAQSGKSQLSVGYGAKLVWGAGQAPDGQLFDAMQTEIRANHIALVSAARGGSRLKLGDRARDVDMDDLFDREFSTKQREKAAEKGQAMEHGGFPIKNGSDLRNAIRAIGRAKNPGAAKAHIKKRARALGLTKLLPESWGDSEGDHEQQRSPHMDRMLTIDGVTIALEDKDGQILERHLGGLTKQIKDQGVDVEALKAKIAELQAQLAAATKKADSKDGEVAALNQKVEDALKLSSTDAIDKAMEARMEVVDRATSFFGDTKYEWRGKSDEQIRRDVVTARLGDQKTKPMSDAVVEGAFLSLTETEVQDGFTRMTQSFSRGATSSNYNDAAAKAYDKRNEELSNRFKRNKKPFGATA
jgi:cation transport regulator ChaB